MPVVLFIAFINPLIERLRACTGVRLTDDRIIELAILPALEPEWLDRPDRR